jgi:hypothetical protein
MRDPLTSFGLTLLSEKYKVVGESGRTTREYDNGVIAIYDENDRLVHLSMDGVTINMETLCEVLRVLRTV